MTVLRATAVGFTASATASVIAEWVAPVSMSMRNGPAPFTITGTITPP